MKFYRSFVPSLQTRKKQSTSDLAENPRWRLEMKVKTLEVGTEKRKSQYLKDRLNNRREIFIGDSRH